MPKSIHFILLSITLLFTSCAGETEKVQIYNPTHSELLIQLNDTTYTVPNNEIIEIDLEEGMYPIQSYISNTKIVDTIIQISSREISEGLLLNVSGEKLYCNLETYRPPSTSELTLPDAFVREIFLVEDSIAEKLEDQIFLDNYVSDRLDELDIPWHHRLNMTSIIIEKHIIVGFIIVYEANQLKIPLKWSYGPNTPYAEEIEVEGDALTLSIGSQVGKLFNSSDLLHFYLLNYMR